MTPSCHWIHSIGFVKPIDSKRVCRGKLSQEDGGDNDMDTPSAKKSSDVLS
eukprot:CAMPEP_0198138268 /NCGR_PEP_ID=MMETSP1443-20131203/1690_1 /TAXON_ID=186043 /ORGANISM="Entomoneis sp., Strain CCMP2396" /LENGTH=50 /DNA_ID=CAMNT_0043799977 /DNA_START=45 /DNA_END=197 /DNA_ORIENTATION=+